MKSSCIYYDMHTFVISIPFLGVTYQLLPLCAFITFCGALYSLVFAVLSFSLTL